MFQGWSPRGDGLSNGSDTAARGFCCGCDVDRQTDGGCGSCSYCGYGSDCALPSLAQIDQSGPALTPEQLSHDWIRPDVTFLLNCF